METSSEQDKRQHKYWLLAGILSLFLLSLFWSVDNLILYLGLGIGFFCFFQYYRLVSNNSQAKETKQGAGKPEMNADKPLDDLLEEIQKGFGASGKGSFVKGFLQKVFGFFFVFVVIVVLGVIFSDEDSPGNYLRAAEFSDKGEYDSAAYYYHLASLDDPENPEIYFERGNSFLNLNRFDSAIAQYDQALSLDSHHSGAQYNKSYALFQTKRYRESIDESKKILIYAPNDLNTMLLIGDSFYSQALLDSALHWYDQAYSNGYRSAILSHLMAYIFDTQGQTPKAIEFYKEALGYDSTIVDIYTRLGELVPGEEGNFYRVKASQLKPVF